MFVYQRWTVLQEGPCAPSALVGRLVSDYGGYLRLEEPESTPECEEHIGATHDNPADAEVACEYADARVVIAMRTDLIEKEPDVVDFFEAYELSDDGIFTLLARYADTGEDAVDVASWWLQNSDEWQDWVGPGVADKVLPGSSPGLTARVTRRGAPHGAPCFCVLLVPSLYKETLHNCEGRCGAGLFDLFPLDGGRLRMGVNGRSLGCVMELPRGSYKGRATVIAGQAICGFQTVSSRRMAFSIVSILRMHAVSATFLCLPRPTSHW